MNRQYYSIGRSLHLRAFLFLVVQGLRGLELLSFCFLGVGGCFPGGLSVYVTIKLHIIAQYGSAILVNQCYSH